MKKSFFAVSLLLALGLFSCSENKTEQTSVESAPVEEVTENTAEVSADTIPVKLSESKLAWLGKKKILVDDKHYGTVPLKSGYLLIADNQLKGGAFVVNMDSIVCEDVTDQKMNAKLISHLKSADFFEVEKFPTVELVITEAKESAIMGIFDVNANLTIKGKTEPIVFQVTLGDHTASGKVVFDRSKFDVRYGSDSFFDNLGNKVIDNNIELNVTLKF